MILGFVIITMFHLQAEYYYCYVFLAFFFFLKKKTTSSPPFSVLVDFTLLTLT